MSQTQLGSMFIGPSNLPTDEILKKSKQGQNLFILDGQNDNVLDHINKKYVITNEHEQDLPTQKEIFTFTALSEQRYAEHLGKRNGLIVPGEDGELLEFRIFESHKYRSNEGLLVEVFARATYLDLKTAKKIDPHRTNAETAQRHVEIALNSTEWQVGTIDYAGIRAIEFTNYTNPYAYLKRIASEFELELKFYITTDGSTVTGRYVDLIDRIGESRGRTAEFGRDLQNIRRIEKTDEIVTALYGIGPEREDGTRLEVFVEDKEALERWGRKGKHIIGVYEPQSERLEMTEQELTQYTQTELNKRINAVVSYEAGIVDLENVPGLENKKIRFADTIRIKDTKFVPPLYLEARIHNQKRDVFNKSNKRVELGDYVEYTEEEVQAIWKTLQQQIRNKISTAEMEDYAEPKKVESDTPPIIKQGVNPIWVDTSKEIKTPHVAIGNAWIPMSLNEEDALVKDVNYNGLMWSEEDGLVVERSDGLMRSVLSGTDGIKIQSFDGTNWVDQFYVDSNGNIHFKGHLQGATGTLTGEFRAGDTVIDQNGILVNTGNFRIVEETTQLESLIYGATNMVNDHSFELVPLSQGTWSHATQRVDHSKMLNFYNWMIEGSKDFARIQSTLGTDGYIRAKHGLQAAILESRYYWTQYLTLDIDKTNIGPYTISAYFSAYEDTSEPTECRVLVHAYDADFNLTQTSSVGGFYITVNPNELYRWKRASHTFRNLPNGTRYLKIRIDQITGDQTRALCDGVQMVPLEYPTVYQPEDSLFKYIQGIIGYA